MTDISGEKIIKIVLAEDQHLVRQGVCALLEDDPGFSVVGEASDGLEAVRIVERLRPDVLVLDVVLPRLNGIEVAKAIRKRAPETRVLILSMHSNEAYIRGAFKNGAAGYILKDETAASLRSAIREIMAGRCYLSPSLSEKAISARVQNNEDPQSRSDKILTHREMQVLQMVADGCTSSMIAERLSISARTVEVHRAHIMHKLGLRGKADLICYALKNRPPFSDHAI